MSTSPITVQMSISADFRFILNREAKDFVQFDAINTHCLLFYKKMNGVFLMNGQILQNSNSFDRDEPFQSVHPIFLRSKSDSYKCLKIEGVRGSIKNFDLELDFHAYFEA